MGDGTAEAYNGDQVKHTMRNGLSTGVRISGAVVCLATLLPALKARKWWIRVFDFPRVQAATLGAAALAVAASKPRKLGTADKLFLGGVGLATATQLFRILKYTPLTPRQVVRKRSPDRGNTISLMIANVRMKNRQSWKVLNAIKKQNPDIVILLEPNERWLSELAELDGRYPWHVKVPRENTYGIAQYSRIEVLESETRYLVQRDVPSIRSKVRLPGGQTFWLYAVHPRPPVHGNLEGHLELPGAGKRDAELVSVALELRAEAQPAIVTGDFNDVAWSHTTRHFQRVSQLLDPRIGRGLYNTYHARHWWLRFPVDHLFHSREFAVVDFGRGPDIGSDHFPILAKLSFERPVEQKPPSPLKGDMQEAVEKLETAGES